jgi:glutamate racemase
MIGFFDSGVGGLTILKAVHERMPEYDTCYLGDTAHAPYGNRTQDEIFDLTWDGCKQLFAQGCDLVIIACNTASSTALRRIQQTKLAEYPGKRVLGIIQPTVETLVRQGHKRIAILSTIATKNSGAYEKEFAKLNPAISVYSQACPNWVAFVENGQTDSAEAREDVKREMEILKREAPDAEAILLACTHFPYLVSHIREALGKEMPIYEQGSLVAEALADYLKRHPEIEMGLGKKGERREMFTK